MTASSKPKNVLWLMSDQHNANVMSFAGHPDVRTPNLDALAAESMTFTKAYCNNPVCGPSRSTFLSGQYPHTHGILGNDIFNYPERSSTNVAAHFRNHGYETAMVGKGHLPKKWMEEGFERLRYCDMADAERDDPRTCHYFNCLVEQGLADAYDLGARHAGQTGSDMRAFISDIPFAHSTEHWCGNQALQFLDQRDQSRPFFLKLSFQRPHDPHCLSPEVEDMYDPETLTLPDNISDVFNGFEGKPVFQQEYIRNRERGYPYRPDDEADLRRQLATYLTLVTVIDAQIGRVIDQLKAGGLWEDTVVVYCADHGDFAGEHGLCLKNFGIYESIHRIPFIWKWADEKMPIGACDQMVESIDLAPTLCSSAGVPMMNGWEGRDIRPVAKGEALGLDATVCEWGFIAGAMEEVFAIRTDRYRLVTYTKFPNDGELYDVISDPGELENLWLNPEIAEVKESLLQKIRQHIGTFSPKVHFRTPVSAEDKAGLTFQVQSAGRKWSDVIRS